MTRAPNREALLDAAMSCIKERGYARTTARDLVAASGTNLGAIGYHFGSKEELLNAAVYRGFREWLDELARPAATPVSGTFWEAIEEGIAALLEKLQSQRSLCVAFAEALAQAERSPRLRAQLAEGYAHYREAVAEYLRAHDGAPEGDASIAALAVAVVALADGLLVQSLIDHESLPSAAELTASLRATLA